jgi:hypothetical protein
MRAVVVEEHGAKWAIVAAAADEHALGIGFGVRIVAELFFQAFLGNFDRGWPGVRMPERCGTDIFWLDWTKEEGGSDEKGLSHASADEWLAQGVDPSSACCLPRAAC